ncbi:MAG: tRNA pseudouridine synthase B, partial [bacterium]
AGDVVSGLDRLTMKLGEKTDTFDAEGKVIQCRDAGHVGLEDIKRVVAGLRGEIVQVPPMYSAVKLGGIPLYALARRGESVLRNFRKVTIYSLEVTDFENPMVRMSIRCSKGTYIRTLVDDIGETLDTGAHVVQLIRTKIGKFDAKASAALNYDDIVKKWITIDEALYDMQEIILKKDSVKKARNGVPVSMTKEHVENVDLMEPSANKGFFKLKDPLGGLLAIARIEGDLIRVERMISANLKVVF